MIPTSATQWWQWSDTFFPHSSVLELTALVFYPIKQQWQLLANPFLTVPSTKLLRVLFDKSSTKELALHSAPSHKWHKFYSLAVPHSIQTSDSYNEQKLFPDIKGIPAMQLTSRKEVVSRIKNMLIIPRYLVIFAPGRKERGVILTTETVELLHDGTERCRKYPSANGLAFSREVAEKWEKNRR